jgi:hypothetical protein
MVLALVSPDRLESFYRHDLMVSGEPSRAARADGERRFPAYGRV